MEPMAEPNTAALVDLAAILASTDWTAPKLHLSKANIVPDKTTILTDLSADEADFDGYAAESVTFSDPYIDGLGNVVATCIASWVSTGNTTPNTLYTAYLTNTGGTKLLMAGVLDGAPIPITGLGSGYSIALSVSLGGGNSETVG